MAKRKRSASSSLLGRPTTNPKRKLPHGRKAAKSGCKHKLPLSENTATYRALGTVELLENVLRNLDYHELMLAKQVSRYFRTMIHESIHLRQTLWLDLPLAKRAPRELRSEENYLQHPILMDNNLFLTRVSGSFAHVLPDIDTSVWSGIAFGFPTYHAMDQFSDIKLPSAWKYFPWILPGLASPFRTCTSRIFPKYGPEDKQYTVYTQSRLRASTPLTLHRLLSLVQKQVKAAKWDHLYGRGDPSGNRRMAKWSGTRPSDLECPHMLQLSTTGPEYDEYDQIIHTHLASSYHDIIWDGWWQ